MKKLLLIIIILLLGGCMSIKDDKSEMAPDKNSTEISVTKHICLAEISSKQIGKNLDGDKVISFEVIPHYEDPYSEVNYIPNFEVGYDSYSEFEVGDIVKITFSATDDNVVVYEMTPDNSLYQTAHTIKDFISITPIKVEIGYGYYDQLEYITLTESDEIKDFLDELDLIVVYEEYTKEHGFGYSNGVINFIDSLGVIQTIEFNQFVVVNDKEYNYRWTIDDTSLNSYLKEKYRFE